MEDFKQKIAPFYWVEHDDSYSVCFADLGQYKQHVFDTRAEEGFEGSGYDWASLASVFLDEKKPKLAGIVGLDPEGSMFCAYSDNKEALQEFILSFKEACDNDEVIIDLFSRAELD